MDNEHELKDCNVQAEILFVGSIAKNLDLIVNYSTFMRSKYDFSDPATKFFYDNLDYAALQSRGYEIWLAHYISSVTDFKYPYNIWQYTSKGSIGGVQSEYADLDIAYYDYANDSDMSERGKNVMVTASSDDFLSFVNTEEKITRYIKTGLASDKEEALRAASLITNQNASKALIDAINKLN